MDQAIEGRELVTLDGLGVLLRGTFHKPQGCNNAESKVDKPKPIGVLFLNSLSLPRAATGDAARGQAAAAGVRARGPLGGAAAERAVAPGEGARRGERAAEG